MSLGVELVSVAAMVIGGLVWGVRLEGRVNANDKANENTQKDVDDLRARHETLQSELVKDVNEIKVALARIQGLLERSHREEING